MKTGRLLTFAALAALVTAVSPALARSSFDTETLSGGGSELPPYLQCVPYARQISGIDIYGDAHTWWSQAEGRYARGSAPRVGAVMAFRPHGNMRLGHVAAISRVIDSRTVLLRHANWSEIAGRRGQVEDNVLASDVSPRNDWSEVRVWHAPSAALGTTHWPVEGFIYGNRLNRPGKAAQGPVFAAATPIRAENRSRANPARASRLPDPIGEIISASRRR